MKRALTVIGGGYGSVVAATPVIAALAGMGFAVDALVESESYQAETLLSGWEALGTIYLTREDVRLREGREYDAVVRTAGNLNGALGMGPEYGPEGLFSARWADRGLESPRHITTHVTTANLSALRALGWNGTPPPCHVEFDEPVGEMPERFAAIAPGASRRAPRGRRRRWPHWEALCKLLHDRDGLEMVVLGEEDDAEEWMSDASRPWLHNLCGLTSIRGAAGVIARCERLYAIDNGLGWIGAALAKPVVSLFGPTDEAAGIPDGVAVTAMASGRACRPCEAAARPRRCRMARCMEEIRPQAVAGVRFEKAGKSEGERLAG